MHGGVMRGGIDIRLDAAAAACSRRGAKLTAVRREVLELLLQSDAPLGAYDLLARLKGTRAGAAPPTIYRALDFLVAQGLAHRLERLGAFVGCVEPGHHTHPVHFLICRGCGEVRELEDAAIDTTLREAAARAGFRPERLSVEIEGHCELCAVSA